MGSLLSFFFFFVFVTFDVYLFAIIHHVDHCDIFAVLIWQSCLTWTVCKVNMYFLVSKYIWCFLYIQSEAFPVSKHFSFGYFILRSIGKVILNLLFCAITILQYAFLNFTFLNIVHLETDGNTLISHITHHDDQITLAAVGREGINWMGLINVGIQVSLLIL